MSVGYITTPPERKTFTAWFINLIWGLSGWMDNSIKIKKEADASLEISILSNQMIGEIIGFSVFAGEMIGVVIVFYFCVLSVIYEISQN